MFLTIDTEKDELSALRAAAAFLLTLTGDMTREESIVPAAASFPPAPPIPDNVLPFAAPAAPAPLPPFGSIPPPPPFPADSLPPAPGLTLTAAPVGTLEVGMPIAGVGIPEGSVIVQRAASSADLDSAGLPWDARIHQKARNKKKDGTWKLQKGIDPGIVAQVTAQLAATRPAAPPPPPVQTVTPVTVPAPPATPAAPAAPAAPGVTFRDLMQKVAKATVANQLTPLQAAEAAQSAGAPNLGSLIGMSHLIPAVNEAIDRILAQAAK